MRTNLVSKKIAFFDFDGTVSNKDSLLEFTKYAVGYFNFYLGLLKISPFLVIYKLKIIPNSKAKRIFLNYFFKGWDYERFSYVSKKYSLNMLNNIVRESALNRILWHKDKGHEVVIVSASLESWLAGWCENNNIKLISTKIDFKNNKIKDNFFIKNCYGEEKVIRIKEVYNLENYETIYAYGDSNGDKELLDIADNKYYKYFS